jgi:hypothetical protein
MGCLVFVKHVSFEEFLSTFQTPDFLIGAGFDVLLICFLLLRSDLNFLFRLFGTIRKRRLIIVAPS